jgi:aspartate-semialdehyde dehydrogenase
MREGVPLVVPEVNMHAVGPRPGIVANPNCSTIQLAVVLAPIRDNYGLRRVIVSTYQSASGAGGEYLEELVADSGAYLSEGEGAVSADSLAFNCLPAVGSLEDGARYSEETKLEKELRKILEMDDLRVCATAVRVPTMVSHCESVVIETETPIDPGDARRMLASAPGIAVLDDPDGGEFPTPRIAEGTDPVWVGRIRRAGVFENDLAFWVVADNLRKGAALNAVQIALALNEREAG